MGNESFCIWLVENNSLTNSSASSDQTRVQGYLASAFFAREFWQRSILANEHFTNDHFHKFLSYKETFLQIGNFARVNFARINFAKNASLLKWLFAKMLLCRNYIAIVRLARCLFAECPCAHKRGFLVALIVGILANRIVSEIKLILTKRWQSIYCFTDEQIDM